MSGGITTTTASQLIRTDVWNADMKEILEDELMANQFASMIQFGEGNTLHIPSVGQLTAVDYNEDESVSFQSPDTGDFTFTISKYKNASSYITDKQKQDSIYASKLLAKIPVMATRAIQEAVEEDLLALANAQTLNDLNEINGEPHRFVASGTGEAMTLADFIQAKLSLDVANVPYQGRVAIVDPKVEMQLRNDPLIQTHITNQPAWSDVLEGGLARSMRFVNHLEGFDIYVSNRLADANETIDGKTTTTGKANMFFSALPEIETFMFAWRQMPMFEPVRNAKRQRDEFILTARYGQALYREEALVVILADTDVTGA